MRWDSTTINFSSALVPVGDHDGGRRQPEIAGRVRRVFPAGVRQGPTPGPCSAAWILNVAGRHEEVGPFSKTVPKYGVSWTPVPSLLVRGSWSEGFPRPRRHGIPDRPRSANLDAQRPPPDSPPRRPASSSRAAPTSRPGRSCPRTASSGLVYEPAFVKGLSVQVNYYDTLQKDLLQIAQRADDDQQRGRSSPTGSPAPRRPPPTRRSISPARSRRSIACSRTSAGSSTAAWM
jgi:hypothetical protein